jgi:hypothetical protein
MPGSGYTFVAIDIGHNGQVMIVGTENNGGDAPAEMRGNFNPTGVGGTFGSEFVLGMTNVGSFDTITPQPNRALFAELGRAQPSLQQRKCITGVYVCRVTHVPGMDV